MPTEARAKTMLTSLINCMTKMCVEFSVYSVRTRLIGWLIDENGLQFYNNNLSKGRHELTLSLYTIRVRLFG